MLNYVITNIFDSPAQTLVNTVNTVGVMGKGVAAEFKRRYPEMFRRYRDLCEEGQIDIGKLYLYRTPNKWVLNFPTKKHWRYPSKIEYIELGLQKFVETYTELGITSISFPQLGCGNGGLPWKTVLPVMEKYLKGLPISTYIHLVRQRDQFVPEHLDPRVLAQSKQLREGVSFNKFWSDLRALAGMDPTNWSRSVEGELEPLVLSISAGKNIVLPAEDFEDLWNSLRLRGGLRQDEFPGMLREYPQVVMKLLLKLDYLQPFQFVKSNSFDQRVLGIRFAPPAARGESSAVSLEVSD
jgi:O-acetyl-ADP-ribose deacetylase (regulator of RNase III)